MVVFVVKIIMVIILLHFFKGITALKVLISSDITTTIGANNENLTCHYDLEDESEYVLEIQLEVRNKTSKQLQPIVLFRPNNNVQLTLYGQYLKNRVIWTNPTGTQTDAILTFNEMKCVDDADYRCKFLYSKYTGIHEQIPTSQSKITVSNLPTMPENIVSSVSLSDVVDGQMVSFICKGNVGNPPGKFEWKKISYDQKTTFYPDVNTTVENEQENCNWYGTSNFSTNVTAGDNKAIVQCQIKSKTDLAPLIATTKEINVFYAVRDVMITTNSTMNKYPQGSSVMLTCKAFGNPYPDYHWFEDSDVNPNNYDGNVHRGSNLIVNESGTYICFANNTVKGTAYNITKAIVITIDNGTSVAGDTTIANFKTIVFGVAAASGIIFLAVVITLYSCCCKRKHVSPSKDMDQLHLSDSNSESAVQISQVYSEVKDSFKRCPKTSSEVPVGVSEYAEVDPTTKTIFYKAEKPFKVDDDNIAHEYATVVKHQNIT